MNLIKQIENDIKNNTYSPVYLFMGEEEYYIDYLTKLIINNSLQDHEKDFNLNILYGKDTLISDIISISKQYPVMSERKLVIVKEAQDKRAYIMKKANYLRDQLKSNNIPYIDSNSHIVPVMAYKSQLAKLYSKELLEKFYIYVQPIFYPTVPKNAARLRITITPKHSKNDIDELVTALISIYQSSAKKKPRKLISKTLKRTPVYT